MAELKAFDPTEAPAFQIEAELKRRNGTVQLHYSIRGPLATQLRYPMKADAPTFADNLWKTTCFEVFLQEEGQQAYEEWNFNPSGNFAHYHFAGFRDRIVDARPDTPLKMQWQISDDQVALLAEIRDSFVGKKIQYSLTTVVHTNPDQLTYWALRHPGPKPDFHSAESRVGRA